jgi:hypothetical protein
MNPRITSLTMLAMALGACDKQRPCELDADITAGCGLELADGALRLGDPLDEMTAAHGDPTWTELGSAGTRFDYGDQGVVGMSADGLTVSTLLVAAPYAGVTVDGLAIGDDALSAPQTLGAGMASPWQDINWHPDQGIGFESTEGAITRIHLIPARDTW